MSKSNTNNPTATELQAETIRLKAKRHELLRHVEQIDKELDQLSSVPQQRRAAVKALRGMVTYCGDIVSPIDEPWEAEQ